MKKEINRIDENYYETELGKEIRKIFYEYKNSRCMTWWEICNKIEKIFENKNNDEKTILIKNYIDEVLYLGRNGIKELSWLIKNVELNDEHLAFWWKRIIVFANNYKNSSLLSVFLDKENKIKYHFNDYKDSIINNAYEKNSINFLRNLSRYKVNIIGFKYLKAILKNIDNYDEIKDLNLLEKVTFPKKINNEINDLIELCVEKIYNKEALRKNYGVVLLLMDLIERYSENLNLDNISEKIQKNESFKITDDFNLVMNFILKKKLEKTTPKFNAKTKSNKI